MQKIIDKLLSSFGEYFQRGQIENDLYLTDSKMLVKLPDCAGSLNF